MIGAVPALVLFGAIVSVAAFSVWYLLTEALRKPGLSCVTRVLLYLMRATLPSLLIFVTVLLVIIEIKKDVTYIMIPPEKAIV